MNILSDYLKNPVFLTDLPETFVKGIKKANLSVIGSSRLFPGISILRGLTRPLLSQYMSKRGRLHKGIPVLIFDEIFSSTMIHAIFAKILLKSKVYVYCFENMPQAFHVRLLGRLFSKFIDGVLCSCTETETQIKSMGKANSVLCPHPIREVVDEEVKEIGRIERVGFIGRLEKEKGVLLLCEAMKRLPGKELVIAGSGCLESELQNYNVNFIGDIPLESISIFYSKIDLLVVPSRTTQAWSEQYGRVIVEAMARGIIVIGSGSGAIPEIIGNLALIFKEGSVSAIYKKVKELSEHSSEELTGISRELRARYIHKYSNSAFFSILHETIELCEQ